MRLERLTRPRLLATVEVILIILLACVPLFAKFPYRVNIFLSWEGAYRMSIGQIPFRDFGTPLGGMYWVIPAIFFKLFGAELLTLIKAQCFINIMSGLAFRSILKQLHTAPGVRLSAILLFCISYSFFNFWPWYNQSVIVYEFIALAFLLQGFNEPQRWRQVLLIVAAALFTVFSFMTKQDGGGMAFGISVVLAGYWGLARKSWRPLLWYIVGFAAFLSLVFAIFLPYGIGYWFNHGQAPHTARISISEILNDFFYYSDWIKFYLLGIVLYLVSAFRRKKKELLADHHFMLFLILTLAILGEAAVFKVTSYTPPDNEIFFHSFGFTFLLAALIREKWLDLQHWKTLLATVAVILLWWSGVYWKYLDRVVSRIIPPDPVTEKSATGENVVNRHTYIRELNDQGIPMSDWVYSDLPSFRGIYMPKPTVEGMKRLQELSVWKKEDPKVLNMSELTPLARDLHFKLERSPDMPLWYHLGVAMFNKQADLIESRIRNNYYDIVLFEYIEGLNNFYPFRIRDELQKDYQLIDSILAPRRGDTQGMIEVYVPKNP